jgi:hypothetical protein
VLKIKRKIPAPNGLVTVNTTAECPRADCNIMGGGKEEKKTFA